MILSGKRHPTVHQILSIARTLKLSESETRYLESLALKDAAQNEWEIAYYTKSLKKQKKSLKLANVNTSKKDLLSNPLVLQILIFLLEMKSKDPKFIVDENIQLLSKQFKITVPQVRDVILIIEKTGLLTHQPDGSFHIVFDKMNHKDLQKKYLKNLLDLSREKIESDYENENSHFIGYTFTASRQNLQHLKSDLRSLMEKYLAEPHDELAGCKIAQACFQVFPVSDFD